MMGWGCIGPGRGGASTATSLYFARIVSILQMLRTGTSCISALSVYDQGRQRRCSLHFLQGNKGQDAAGLQLLEGKISVAQILSLCQALGYFPTGVAPVDGTCISVFALRRLGQARLTTAWQRSDAA